MCGDVPPGRRRRLIFVRDNDADFDGSAQLAYDQHIFFVVGAVFTSSFDSCEFVLLCEDSEECERWWSRSSWMSLR